MKTLIKKVLQDQSVSIEELVKLVNYISSIENLKEPNPEEMHIILNLFNMGQFTLKSIKNTILSNPSLYGLESIKIFDKNNNLIKFDVKELNSTKDE